MISDIHVFQPQIIYVSIRLSPYTLFKVSSSLKFYVVPISNLC